MAIQSGDKVVITFPEVVKPNTKLDKGQVAYVRLREEFSGDGSKNGPVDNEPILYIGNSSDVVPNPPHELSEDNATLRPVNVANGAIRTEKLADNAVTFDKLNEEVISDIENIGRQAEQAQETADSIGDMASSAIDTAYGAMFIAEKAEQNANTAMSIAKGANQAGVFDTEADMYEWIREDLTTVIGHAVTSSTVIVVAADRELIKVTESEGWNDVEVGSSIYPNMCDVTITFTDGTRFDISSGPFGINEDEAIGRCYWSLGFFYENEGKTIKSVSAEFYLAGPYQGDRKINKNLTYRIYDESKPITDLIKPYNISIGTNLYIRDTGVSDYWWDGGKAQPLETQKVDLTDIENGLQSILDAVNGLIGGES